MGDHTDIVRFHLEGVSEKSGSGGQGIWGGGGKVEGKERSNP